MYEEARQYVNKNNIILIGMPGSGKSTVGVLLAKSTGMPFLDTDLLIQQREGTLLQEIINRDGIEKFLKIEEEVYLSLNTANHIIATGGSVIYSKNSINHLETIGCLVYLKLPYRTIQARIRNITTRGIAMGSGQTLLDLYKERVPLYERYAGIVVDCRHKHIEQIVSEIRAGLKISSDSICKISNEFGDFCK